MTVPDDVDVEALIFRLAGPLAPPAQEAFRYAAEPASRASEIQTIQIR